LTEYQGYELAVSLSVVNILEIKLWQELKPSRMLKLSLTRDYFNFSLFEVKLRDLSTTYQACSLLMIYSKTVRCRHILFSAVGKATGYGLDDQGFGVRVPVVS
jgi:hypothetical protein